MSEEKSTPNNPISAAIDKLVSPVYEDLLRPSFAEIGRGVGGLAAYYMHGWRAKGALAQANLSLLEKTLTSKLEGIPDDKKIAPEPSILIPALDAAAFAAHQEDIRELFANLLASAANSDKADKVHPSFIEIIKQLTPEEARLIKKLSSRPNHAVIIIAERTPTGRKESIKNIIDDELDSEEIGKYWLPLESLARHRLITIEYGREIRESAYNPIIHNIKSKIPDVDFIEDKDYDPDIHGNSKMTYVKGIIEISMFGMMFNAACIK